MKKIFGGEAKKDPWDSTETSMATTCMLIGWFIQILENVSKAINKKIWERV